MDKVFFQLFAIINNRAKNDLEHHCAQVYLYNKFLEMELPEVCMYVSMSIHESVYVY